MGTLNACAGLAKEQLLGSQMEGNFVDADVTRAALANECRVGFGVANDFAGAKLKCAIADDAEVTVAGGAEGRRRIRQGKEFFQRSHSSKN